MCVRVCASACVSPYGKVCMSVRVCVCEFVCNHICEFMGLCVLCESVCACVRLSVCVCACVCVCLHHHQEGGRQRGWNPGPSMFSDRYTHDTEQTVSPAPHLPGPELRSALGASPTGLAVPTGTRLVLNFHHSFRAPPPGGFQVT